MYLLQISALDILPFTTPVYVPDMPKSGLYPIRHPSGIVTGAIIDLKMSAISDHPLEYLTAVRNCLFSADQEGHFSLDQEGPEIFVELHLKPDGTIACSANLPSELLTEIDGSFTNATFPLSERNDIKNIIVEEERYEQYYLVFDAPASSWCKSVIALAKEENEKYELEDIGLYNVYDASGYVRDLEEFMDKFSKKRDGQMVDEILSQIQASPAAPILRPGSNAR